MVINIVLLVGLTATLFSVVPKFQSIFSDMGQKLPLPTQLILHALHWPGILALGGAMATILLASILTHKFASAAVARDTNVVILLIILAMFGLLVVALFLPLVSLIQGMQGGR